MGSLQCAERGNLRDMMWNLKTRVRWTRKRWSSFNGLAYGNEGNGKREEEGSDENRKKESDRLVREGEMVMERMGQRDGKALLQQLVHTHAKMQSEAFISSQPANPSNPAITARYRELDMTKLPLKLMHNFACCTECAEHCIQLCFTGCAGSEEEELLRLKSTSAHISDGALLYTSQTEHICLVTALTNPFERIQTRVMQFSFFKNVM